MTKSVLEIKELSIVLMGRFNPVIFHPQWLLRKDLIREGEAETANLKINHPEVSEFDLESCAIQVFPERFSASSTQETHFRAVRDLVVNIFECLPETPSWQLGINLHHHYKFDDMNEYMDFGHKILPKDPLWSKHLKDPGLTRIWMEGERPDEQSGKIIAVLGISGKIKGLGVDVHINDHYDLYKQEEMEKMDSSRSLEILKKNWDKSLKKSTSIIEDIYKYGLSK